MTACQRFRAATHARASRQPYVSGPFEWEIRTAEMATFEAWGLGTPPRKEEDKRTGEAGGGAGVRREAERSRALHAP